MKLARYKLFTSHVCRDSAIANSVTALRFYRLFEGTWYDEDDDPISDNDIKSKLEKTRKSTESWRERSSIDAYFPVIQLDSVVFAKFNAPPRKNKRQIISNRLGECVISATNEFKATHDTLTGLYNRERFDEEMNKEIKRAEESKDNEAELENTIRGGCVALLAFDIDFFKQVNDTFGHGYGDVVLRCLAERLETVCLDQIGKFDGAVRIVPARPSGEEFLVLLAGSFSLEQEVLIAEGIRTAIELRPLPDDGEWSHVERDVGMPEGAILPPASQRRLTVSIGVASVRAPFANPDAAQIRATLKGQADAALYRAKGAGRNQTVAYREILTRYGRVLEHHADTRIVAIDLGHKVAVRTGQEFRVYHPTFSGKEPFYFRDGRTQKLLGHYPAIPCGKIEVFSTQPDVSFCNVLENTLSSTFPIGSILEAIPLGSIQHVSEAETRAGAGLSRQSELQSAITALAQRGQIPSACVISLTNAEQIAVEHGTAYVNRILSYTLDLLHKITPPTALLAQIAPTDFGVLFPEGHGINIRRFDTDLIKKVQERFRGSIGLVVGCFGSDDVDGIMQETGATLDLSGALQFAQYAALTASQSQVVRFSASSASSILYKSRKNTNMGNLVRDYESISRLGLRTANMENQLALGYFEQGRYPEAVEAIDRALSFDPSDQTLWLNGALLKYRNGDLPGAVRCYRTAVDRAAGAFELGPPYLTRMAGLHLRAYRSSVPEVTLEDTVKLLQSAIAHEQTNAKTKEALQEGLLSLMSKSRPDAQPASSHSEGPSSHEPT